MTLKKFFEKKVEEVGLAKVFHPFELPESDNVEYNKVVSFLLDALYMIPNRSDIAFDHVWRALEYIFTHNGNGSNITKLIQDTLNVRIENVISNDSNYRNALYIVFEAIPHQVCEYLLKKITNENSRLEDSKIYKRLVLNDGDPNKKIINLDALMHYFSGKKLF
ncbi:hypothetical protein HA44_03185 [Mixta gaviniae]|nr:hypothetical protein HA44_03185 [Mixta gaviniae]